LRRVQRPTVVPSQPRTRAPKQTVAAERMKGETSMGAGTTEELLMAAVPSRTGASLRMGAPCRTVERRQTVALARTEDPGSTEEALRMEERWTGGPCWTEAP